MGSLKASELTALNQDYRDDCKYNPDLRSSWEGLLVLSESMTRRGTNATALSSQLLKDLFAA